MWIFSVCIAVCMLWYAEAAASDVVITCESCNEKGTSLSGDVGGNLSILFTVNKETFASLTIYYNGTRNKIVVNSFLNVVNVKGVTDKTRFVIPKTPTKGVNKWSVGITLKDLSMADDKLEFSYAYQDANADDWKGASAITVYDPLKEKSKQNGSSDNTIIIIVIVILIILIIAILVLLYKKGILPTEGCVNMCGGRSRVPASDGGYALQDNEKGNPKRHAPQPPAPTEYAELGPGGRLTHPPDKPDKSMYAQVKTENMNYPEPEYEAPSGVIV